MAEARKASAGEPAVQAGYMKNLLASLKDRGRLPDLAAQDAELVAAVGAASQLAWLPIDINLRAVDAIAASLGEQRGLDMLAECVHAQFDTPLWRNFIGGAVRLLGRDPASLGRWIPRALQLVFRDCGTWSVAARSDCELELTGRELPPPLREHGLWLRSLAIGMKPLFLLTGTDGTSRLETTTAAEAVIRIAWKEPA